MPAIIMKQVLMHDPSRGTKDYIGNAIYGAINLDQDNITSIYDLLSAQITASKLDAIAPKVNSQEINGTNQHTTDEVEFLAKAITMEGRWRIVIYLPHIIDLSSLPFKTLRVFLGECLEHQLTYGKHLGCIPESDLLGPDDAQTQENDTIDQIQRLLSNKTAGYVYLLRSASGYWKIGKTVNPADRIKTFSVKLPFEVEYEHLISCEDYSRAETELHARFAPKRVNGEWFCLDEADVAWIKAIKYL